MSSSMTSAAGSFASEPWWAAQHGQACVALRQLQGLLLLRLRRQACLQTVCTTAASLLAAEHTQQMRLAHWGRPPTHAGSPAALPRLTAQQRAGMAQALHQVQRPPMCTLAS